MGTDDYDGHWNMMDGGGSGGWVMALVMLLVLAVLVVGLLYVARLTLRAPEGPGRREPRDDEHAAGILRERLATGEIDEPEYESRLRRLRQR